MSHALIISQWPSISAFADDIGVPYGTAKAMRRRGAIPDGYWIKVVDCAKARGLEGVTLEKLAEIAAAKLEAAE